MSKKFMRYPLYRFLFARGKLPPATFSTKKKRQKGGDGKKVRGRTIEKVLPPPAVPQSKNAFRLWVLSTVR